LMSLDSVYRRISVHALGEGHSLARMQSVP
jgi:hypothetical protein